MQYYHELFIFDPSFCNSSVGNHGGARAAPAAKGAAPAAKGAAPAAKGAAAEEPEETKALDTYLDEALKAIEKGTSAIEEFTRPTNKRRSDRSSATGKGIGKHQKLVQKPEESRRTSPQPSCSSAQK